MVARGLLMAGLMLGAAVLAAPSVSSALVGACSPLVAQDDADSGRDAGDGPASAVQLPDERRYDAAIGYPGDGGVDGEDWYTAHWDGDEEVWDVMVEVQTSAAPYAYSENLPMPAPHIELAAYEDGEDEPTHTSEVAANGSAVLDFETTQGGTWHFQVLLEEASSTAHSCSGSAPGGEAPVETYKLYWGCDPHCVQAR